MSQLTVACVLKSGGIYDASWVARLQAGVDRHMPFSHRFVCLTDMPVDCEAIDLEHDWPGWWSKIELFRPDLFIGPVLYLDLDSVVVGNLAHLIVNSGFCAMREPSTAGGICSSTMAWSGDLSVIYRAFCEDPERHMHEWDEVRPGGRIGDQGFIMDVLNPRYVNCFPRMAAPSYKHHCRKVLPSDAAVVAFHGRPKPFECLSTHWVRENWRV